jgi:two-component system, response regulator YesN
MKWIYGRQDWKTLERGLENCYLLTNGLGGFSSLTMTGAVARNDHSVFMACTKAPNHRVNMVHRIKEELGIGETKYVLSTQEFADGTKEEAKTFFQSDEGIIVLKDLWNRIVIISECEGIPFAECLDILNSLIKTKYKCRLFVGISGKFSGWREIHMAYLDALKFIQDKRMGENKKNTEDLRAWKQIENAVRRGNIEEAQRLGQMILDNEETDLVEVNLRLQTRFQKLCIDLEFSQNNLMFLKEIAWVYTKEQIKYCVGNIITELVIRRKINSGDNNSEVIEEILKYMIHHMGEEASLNFLAEKFSLSSCYLSKLIRNFTGKKYVELLSDIRLLKLLEMIHTTNMKDYDIGTMIGIQDPHYLSIWFKKMMGLSVTEYRKCISEKTK